MLINLNENLSDVKSLRLLRRVTSSTNFGDSLFSQKNSGRYITGHGGKYGYQNVFSSLHLFKTRPKHTMFSKSIVLLAAFAAISAVPMSEYQYYAPGNVDDTYEVYSPEEVYELHRYRRSFQPGTPNLPQIPGQNGGWSVNPNVARDENGNTKADIQLQHVGNNHEFNAGWGKVVRGPNKAKPTWHVGGTYRW